MSPTGEHPGLPWRVRAVSGAALAVALGARRNGPLADPTADR